jgi:Tn3 transposase DDE domain
VLESKSIKLQNRVADIVKELEFQGDDHTDVLAAIQYYQHKHGTITQAAPVEYLDPYEQRLLVDASGKFRVSLYKALLFIKIAESIKAGTLHLKHSYKYRSLDDYLIPKAAWEAHRDDYLQRAELLTVANCQQTLQTLAERLDQQYHHTNQHIMQGANPHFHRHKDQSFHLSTPTTRSDDSELLRDLLPHQHYISLVEVLSTVSRLTGFLEAFEPWYVKYARSRPPDKTFLAGVVGYGCFIGIGKIARISKWINATELETTINGYFTLENLHAANDLILKFMDQLELPEVYRRQAGWLHTSSDGQKYGVAVESLNANYSFKYLGKDAGVSSYTFIDERHFLWHHDVISASEREAAYVIDGLMHNDVIKSDIHSTDTHGYTVILTLVRYTVCREGSGEGSRAAWHRTAWSPSPSHRGRQGWAQPRLSPATSSTSICARNIFSVGREKDPCLFDGTPRKREASRSNCSMRLGNLYPWSPRSSVTSRPVTIRRTR